MNMAKITLILIIYCTLSINSIFASRILCVSIFPSYSHQIVYDAIWKELAKRGHEVVLITPNPLRDPSLKNLREIDISFAYNIWRDNRAKWFREIGKPSKRDLLKNDYNTLSIIFEKTMQHPNVQELLNESFDLQIAEWVYPAVFGLSEHFHCPLVTVGSIEMFDVISNDIGNPVNPAVYSNFLLPFTSARMTFKHRLQSIEYSFWLRWVFDFQVYPTCDQILRQYLNSDIPPIKEVMKNISLNLVNRNSIFFTPRLSMPNVIEFSGIHIQNSNELINEDIKDFLDNAPNGVVYFSFGTNIKSSSLSNRLKTVLFTTFNQLPYRVLLSYENSSILNLSDNIKIFQWVAQTDILGHKNTKVFITQGGLQSTEEAIRNRVPMIGIPFIVDQPRNVHKMVELGIAKYIDPERITVDSFMNAIIEVAENITYKKNIEKVARILEDEPIPSIDKVIWWIEYTLRHKGAKHLKSPFLTIPWYQIYWLDVITFIFVVFILLSVLVIYILSLIKCITHRIKSKQE